MYRSKRSIDMAIEQAKALRYLTIVTELKKGEKNGALWAIGTAIQGHPLPSPFAVRSEWGSRLESIRTRLNSFSDQEQGRPINWGYLQWDLSVRSYYLT